MSANGQIGQGTVLSIGNATGGTSTTWTPLALIGDIPIPPSEVTIIESKSQDSDVVKKIKGMINYGNLDLEFIVNDFTQYVTIRDMLGDDADFKITVKGSLGDFIVQGFISSVGGAIPVEEKITANFTIVVNDHDYTAAS